MSQPLQEFDPVLKGARYAPPEVQGMGGRKQGPSAMLYEHRELYVEQSVEKLRGCCTACEIRNHYGIYPNKDAQDANRFMLTAHEESSGCARMLCSPFHAFRLTMGYPEATTAHLPKVALPIAFLDRPCSFCCYGKGTLSDHSGAPLATFTERNSSVCCINSMKIDVTSSKGEKMNTIEGPSCCWLHLCKHSPWRDPFIFALLKDDELTGGSIKVMPNDCCRCCFTNADDYVVTFPVSATANERAILLGMTFFVDSCYFQPKFRRNNYKKPERPLNTPHPFQPRL